MSEVVTFQIEASKAFKEACMDVFCEWEHGHLHLPARNCNVYHIRPSSVPLPTLSSHRSSILENSQEAGISGSGYANLKAYLTRPRAPLTTLPLDNADFKILREVVAAILGVGEEFPILPGARVEPLKFSLKTADRPQVLAGDDTILVDSVLADRLDALGLRGLGLARARSKNIVETYFELTVTGEAIVLACDEEIAEFLFDSLGDVKDASDYARCPGCGMFPRRRPLPRSIFPVESQVDAFQLKDFAGIYLTDEAADKLRSCIPNAVDILAVLDSYHSAAEWF